MILGKSYSFARPSAVLCAGLAITSCHASPMAVEASALEVRATLSPARIAASGPSGGDTAVVIVSVTNPKDRPVVIELGGPPYKSGQIPAAETEGIGFGVRVVSVDSGPPRGPSTWTWGQPRISFLARQTLTFTVTVGAAHGSPPPGSGMRGVTPGRYRVVASFGKQEAAPLELRVDP